MVTGVNRIEERKVNPAPIEMADVVLEGTQDRLKLVANAQEVADCEISLDTVWFERDQDCAWIRGC